MSIIQGTAKSGSTGFYDYPIGDSLRFDGSSYLSRSFTGGNQLIHTFSMWVKRATLTPSGHSDMIFSAGASADSNRIFALGYDSTQHLNAWGYSPDAFNLRYNRKSTQVFRDTNAWYHIVLAIDYTNQSGHDRVKLYVNGGQITSFDTQTTNDASSGTSAIGHSYPYYIGRYAYASQPIIKSCYMANIQFIDGQALDASYFGETKDDIWIPKTFDGTSSTGGSTVSTDYGTNGFLLDFSSISGTTINDTAPIDTNHSSANNWTATGF